MIRIKKPLVQLKNYFQTVIGSIKNEKLKQNILQAIPFWIAAFITSLMAMVYARTFAMAEKLTSLVFNYHAWLLFILSPICFIVSWWLVKKYAPYSS